MSTGPGCCGDLKSRVEIIKQATKYIVEGHNALAKMYEQLAGETEDAMEKIQYGKAALNQRELAIKSGEMTLPDDEADAIERRDTDPAPGVTK
jgi:hypothetical protein